MRRSEDSVMILDTLSGIREVGEDYADRIDEIHGMYDRKQGLLERTPGKLLATTGRLDGPIWSLHQLRFRDTILMFPHEGEEYRSSREIMFAQGQYFPPPTFEDPNGEGEDYGTDSPWWGFTWGQQGHHYGGSGVFQADWPGPSNPNSTFTTTDDDGNTKTTDIPDTMAGFGVASDQQSQDSGTPQGTAGGGTGVTHLEPEIEAIPTSLNFSELAGDSGSSFHLTRLNALGFVYTKIEWGGDWIILAASGHSPASSGWIFTGLSGESWGQDFSVAVDESNAPPGLSSTVITLVAVTSPFSDSYTVRNSNGDMVLTQVAVSILTHLTLSLLQVSAVRRNIPFLLLVRAHWNSSYNALVNLNLVGGGLDNILPVSTPGTGWGGGMKTVACTITGGTGSNTAQIFAQDGSTPSMIGSLDVTVSDPDPFAVTVPSSIWRSAAFDMTVDANDPLFVPHSNVPITEDAPDDSVAPDAMGGGWTAGAKTTSLVVTGTGADFLPIEFVVIDALNGRRGTASSVLHDVGTWPATYTVEIEDPTAWWPVNSGVAPPYTLTKTGPGVYVFNGPGSYDITLSYIAAGSPYWRLYLNNPFGFETYRTNPWPVLTPSVPTTTVGGAAPMDRTYWPFAAPVMGLWCRVGV